MFCHKCGTALPPGAQFCPACGVAVPASTTDTFGISTSQPPTSPFQVNAAPAAEATAQVTPRPWIRYWAKTLDIFLFALPAGVVIAVLAPQRVCGGLPDSVDVGLRGAVVLGCF